MTARLQITLAALAALGLAHSLANVATSPSYALSSISIDAGGGRSAGGAYVNDTVHASFGGPVSSPSYTGYIGFAGQINNPPIALPDIATRLTNSPARIGLDAILANDSDPDGDEITLIDADRASPAGGSVGFFPDSLQYNPPAAYNGVDTFSYTIADSFGDRASATITVVIAQLPEGQPVGTLQTIFLNDGQVLVHLEAPANYDSFTIQWAENLVSPVWRDLATSGPGDDGSVLAIDTPGAAAQRYYRAVFR